MGRKLINEVGNKYGRLTVISRAENKYNKPAWLCACDCGKETVVGGCSLRNGGSKSCGCLQKERASETHKGKHHSDETRKLMSENHVDMSGENHPMYGRTGENSPTWNPNLTDEDRQHTRHYPEYNEWRSAVYERDNYTCQCCGKVGGNLNAHHMESYSSNKELRTTVSNGVTLCEKCHKDFHHIYGRGDNTKEQLIAFLKGKGVE